MTSDPNAAARPERTAMIASAAVGAVAVLAVLLVTLLTSDKATGAALGAPGTDGTGSQNGNGVAVGGGVAVSGGGVSVTGGSSGGGSSQSSATTTLPKPTAAYLRTHFPLPPGSVPDTRYADLHTDPKEQWYDLRASSIAPVKQFFDQHLPEVGVTPEDHPGIQRTNGVITGYMYSYFQEDPPVDLSLDFILNPFGDAPGVAIIQVRIQ